MSVVEFRLTLSGGDVSHVAHRDEDMKIPEWGRCKHYLWCKGERF